MYTVLLHELIDADSTKFYKISYTGKAPTDFERSQRWPAGSYQLLWSRQFDLEAEAKTFKAACKEGTTKYLSQIVKSAADTFTSDKIPNFSDVEIDPEKLAAAKEAEGAPVHVYLIKFEDGWYKVGVSVNKPTIPKANQATEQLVWARTSSEGRAKAEKFRDWVFYRCSIQRTSKYDNPRAKMAFTAEKSIENIGVLSNMFHDYLAAEAAKSTEYEEL